MGSTVTHTQTQIINSIINLITQMEKNCNFLWLNDTTWLLLFSPHYHRFHYNNSQKSHCNNTNNMSMQCKHDPRVDIFQKWDHCNDWTVSCWLETLFFCVFGILGKINAFIDLLCFAVFGHSAAFIYEYLYKNLS